MMNNNKDDFIRYKRRGRRKRKKVCSYCFSTDSCASLTSPICILLWIIYEHTQLSRIHIEKYKQIVDYICWKKMKCSLEQETLSGLTCTVMHHIMEVERAVADFRQNQKLICLKAIFCIHLKTVIVDQRYIKMKILQYSKLASVSTEPSLALLFTWHALLPSLPLSIKTVSILMY